jgi:ATP-dependent DNA helicase PIF1
METMQISIPIIKLRPQDLTNQPCEWERLQFPVRLAYAMTIDKSQGETLAKAGVWLVTAVFGHGQLYVAASRTGACSTVMFAVLPYKPDDPFITVNLVYRHILDFTIVVLLIRLSYIYNFLFYKHDATV